jgi:multidrug efflux system membrane fusion protein
VVDNQMQAHLRQIVAGAQIGGDTVIERGIEAGETVVTDGQLLLAPGARVKIRSSL